MEGIRSSADFMNYVVSAERSSDLAKIDGAAAKDDRMVVSGYMSDSYGNRLREGKHLTLVLAVAPDMPICSPIQYSRGDQGGRNNWINYGLIIRDKKSGQTWNHEKDRIIPLVDDFDLSGSHTFQDVQMSYASFAPPVGNTKSPLIIWLHGGGEGGSDPTIPLIANRAANYAAPAIQQYFDGAYVLVPQCPTAWMHNKEGVSTRGKEDDMYHEGLMDLIENYVAANTDIDRKRIYVGGCSNGGYMSLKLILEHPDYFAAGFISALAYQSQYITDEQIDRIKNVPIWFVHSADDGVTLPEKTAVPVYKRLVSMGAENVHFSFYDHVIDLSGFFGGQNHQYNGHWSWIYSHVNDCKLDFDGTPVKHLGKAVTIMEWMAAMSK